MTFLLVLIIGIIIGIVLEKVLGRFEINIDKLVGTDELYHPELEDKETKLRLRQPKLPICEPLVHNFFCLTCNYDTQHFRFPRLKWCCNECGNFSNLYTPVTREELAEEKARP